MRGDFLTVRDLGYEGLQAVLELAGQVKREPHAFGERLAGAKVGLFFEKPSTRTRISSEVAVVDLGGYAVVLKQDEVGLGRRESVADVGRVLDRYLDVLALRVFDHRHLVTIAEHASAPVINLLSDVEHPCQALADLQTIAETLGSLAGRTLTYVGDGNNVAHSLMVAGAMSGMQVRVVTPGGYEPSDEVLAEATRLAAGGGSVEVGSDVDAMLAGSDVVYTDVWASMGQEGESTERQTVFAPYRIDLAALERAGEAIFLHCLPAHRGEEVTDEVMEHPRSRVFDQAENRMHAFKALLLYLLEAV